MENDNKLLNIIKKANENRQDNGYFNKAGVSAGREFARNLLDITMGLDEYTDSLSNIMNDYNINDLRMEKFDLMTGDTTIAIEQDIDYNALPITDESLCDFNSGFITGILEMYTGRKYNVSEEKCTDNNNRIHRYTGTRHAA
jgi:hypothetical protein